VKVKALVLEVWAEWERDNAALLAGAVAFFAAFSVGPLLLMIISMTRMFVDDEWARAQLFTITGQFLNARTAGAVAGLIAPGGGAPDGISVPLVSGVLMLFSASAVFRHLRLALDLILDVPHAEERKWLQFVRARVFAVVMVAGALLIILLSIALTTALASVRERVPTLPAGDIVVWHVVDLIVTTVVIAAIFGAVIRFVPQARLPWRNIAQGVGIAAILFSSGQYVFGLYLAGTNLTGVYGAAASLFVVLLAVWFAVNMLFIGAELAKVLARRT
jgi:membrane protein